MIGRLVVFVLSSKQMDYFKKFQIFINEATFLLNFFGSHDHPNPYYNEAHYQGSFKCYVMQ